jgi:hypothetical protein
VAAQSIKSDFRHVPTKFEQRADEFRRPDASPRAARCLPIEVAIRLWLSTPRGARNRGCRKDSRVASTDDIHTLVENPGNNPKKKKAPESSGAKPPGQFVSNELEEQTARFIEDVKGLAKRRREHAAEEGPGPPPRGGHRSRRR